MLHRRIELSLLVNASFLNLHHRRIQNRLRGQDTHIIALQQAFLPTERVNPSSQLSVT